MPGGITEFHPIYLMKILPQLSDYQSRNHYLPIVSIAQNRAVPLIICSQTLYHSSISMVWRQRSSETIV